MKALVKARLIELREQARHQLLDPVLGRLDHIDGRLGRIERRLDEMQVFLEQVSARAAAGGERALGVAESTARAEARLDEIERSLGAR